MNTSGLQKAIESVGGISKLADHLGERVQTVSNWTRRDVPAEKCPAIERVTRAHGREIVICEQLRPDVDWAVLREQANPQQAA